MIDVSQLSYDIRVVGPKSSFSLGSVFEDLSWEDGKSELACRAQFRVRNLSTDAGYLSDLLALGNKVSIWGYSLIEVFRGTHFKWSYADDEVETISITAYDDLYYLQGSKDQVLINDGDDAATVLRRLLESWGFIVGQFDLPAVALPKNKLKGSVGDIIAGILGEVFYQSKGAYFLQMNYSGAQAVVDVIRPGANKVVYVFNGNHYESAHDEQDITQLVTVVKIFGENAGPFPDDTDASVVPGSVAPPIDETLTSPLLNTYGRLQDIVEVTGTDDSNAHTKAQNILDEKGNPKRVKQVILPDIATVKKGDIHRFDNVGTLNGYYLISGVAHDAKSGKMTATIDSSGTVDYQHLRISADKQFLFPDKPL